METRSSSASPENTAGQPCPTPTPTSPPKQPRAKRVTAQQTLERVRNNQRRHRERRREYISALEEKLHAAEAALEEALGEVASLKEQLAARGTSHEELPSPLAASGASGPEAPRVGGLVPVSGSGSSLVQVEPAFVRQVQLALVALQQQALGVGQFGGFHEGQKEMLEIGMGQEVDPSLAGWLGVPGVELPVRQIIPESPPQDVPLLDPIPLQLPNSDSELYSPLQQATVVENPQLDPGSTSDSSSPSTHCCSSSAASDTTTSTAPTPRACCSGPPAPPSPAAAAAAATAEALPLATSTQPQQPTGAAPELSFLPPDAFLEEFFLQESFVDHGDGESTTLCRDAYVLISQQNFKGVSYDDIQRWLWAGYRKSRMPGEGCRVHNGLLFSLLAFISET